jgi:hypothetical protein
MRGHSSRRWKVSDRLGNQLCLNSAASSLPASSLRSVFGAARPDSGNGHGVRRPDHASGWGLGSEPDDNVPDVVELRCAGRSGPGQRERVGCGGDDPGGGKGEGGRRAAPNESDRRPEADCQCGLGTQACAKRRRTIGRRELLGSVQPILVVYE